jgi:anhydro-N-acetylmuramic acid kinase
MVENDFWALGLMSGTSLDGIDAALIRTDGNYIFEIGEWLTLPYDEKLRSEIRKVIYGKSDIAKIEYDITLQHVEAVKLLLNRANLKPKQVQVIGFHGQTIAHRPAEGITWQIGNGALLAAKTGIDVVCDFRRQDVAMGGQGAPLVPLFHAAMVRKMDLPIAILNIGGIANVTWIGKSEHTSDDILAMDIIAFDTGPGNVLINEWLLQNTGKIMDENGELALQGKVNDKILAKYMSDPFFKLHPPKSLDRNYFNNKLAARLSNADGAATLTEFTATSIALAETNFPKKAKHWFIAGGGRHNTAIMQGLKKHLKSIKPVENIGWQGDALEAQAFAYLAVRSLKKLPLTLPTTTGVAKPTSGGAYYAR